MLNVRPVHILARERHVRFDRLARVVRAADDQPADDEQSVPMEVLDRLRRRVAGSAAVLAAGVLRRGFEEREILVEDVFDAEEHVAEARAAHQRRKRRAMLRDGRRHRLDDVIQVVEAAVDDRATERLEPLDIERDVVVDEEDRARAVPACVGDVGQDAIDAVDMKVPAAHLDDRAEAAVVGATARGLDDVDRPAHQRIAAEHAGAAVGEAQRVGREPRDGTGGVRNKSVRCPECEPGDAVERSSGFERSKQFRQRSFAFAADDHVVIAARDVRVRGEAWIVAAHDDLHAGSQCANERGKRQRRRALKCHDGHADDVRFEIVDEPSDR